MPTNDSRFKEAIHVPRLKPSANDTWEVQGTLPGAAAQSETIPMDFPGPCRIVGIYPSLSGPPAGGGLVVPTLDDIMVLLEFNQQRRYTAQVGQTTPAQFGQGFVTLNSLNTLFRDLNIEVTNARPTMNVQYRWKRFVQGAPIFTDQVVALAMYVEIDD